MATAAYKYKATQQAFKPLSGGSNLPSVNAVSTVLTTETGIALTTEAGVPLTT